MWSMWPAHRLRRFNDFTAVFHHVWFFDANEGGFSVAIFLAENDFSSLMSGISSSRPQVVVRLDYNEGTPTPASLSIFSRRCFT